MKRGPCRFARDDEVRSTVEGTVLEDTEWGSLARVDWDNEDNGAYSDDSDSDDEYQYPEYRWGVEEHGVENVDIWDLASGQITKTLTGHNNTVTSVTFSPDGSQLASASDDGTVRVI